MMHKKKALSLLSVFVLMFALILPTVPVAAEKTSTTPTVIGNPDNPTITITKLKQEPGKESTPSTGKEEDINKEDNIPVEGVTYKVTQIKKLLPGALETGNWKEAYEEIPEEKQESKEYTTDENGQIKLEKLPLGVYEIVEVSGPEDILINPTPFTVDLPMTTKDRDTLNYDVHVYPKNEIIRGEGEFKKTDATGNGLEGVKFQLYKVEGDKAEKVKEYTTKEGGIIALENLGVGNYYLQEVETVEGYALDTTKIHFEVTSVKDDEGKNVSGIVWKDKENEGTFKNYKQPEVDKKIVDENGNLVDELEIVRNKEYKYQLKIKVPENIKDYRALGVTDTLDSRLEYADSWEVKQGANKKEDIKFSKVDAKDAAGKNTEKLIWEVNNFENLTGEDIIIEFTAKIKRDAKLDEGTETIPNKANLHFNNGKGSYTKPINPKDPENPEPTDPEDPYYPYPEKPDEPNPDKPTDPKYPPTPEEPPVTPPVEVKPLEGALKIVKVDANDNKITLEGAEFKLTSDEAGKNVLDTADMGVIKVNKEEYNGLLENLVTGEDGTIEIEGLNPGTYYIHETKAPEYTTADGEKKPYRLLTKPVKVEVLDAETKAVTVENSKSGWNLPTTGGIGTILFTLVGLTMILASVLLYVKRRKEEQNVVL